ncbi:hypothetical protein SDC9_44964 [bioreactor metagenome]|jgi:hypothetical protein|uniref:NodB homology domain-containing protein n=1 Tax=bioreactor metagenome TaxID=1076179 RepID=A0A644W4S2_9ZZZZ|nr:hypothetical protein [Paludibacter sp.]
MLKADFTIKIYRELLLTLQSAGYEFFTFADWCEGKAAEVEKYIILRHDIDKLPGHALRIARVEAAMKIQATYYWLTRKPVFHPVVIRKITSMGHEIGYHYRDWVDAHGNVEKALELFQLNMTKLGAVSEIKTISMDGCPWSKYNNLDMWHHYDYRSFGIIGEPYFDIFGAGQKKTVKDVFYLTDTGRMWNGDRFSIRDKVAVNQLLSYKSTYELIDAAGKGLLPNKIMITTHPQRWSAHYVEWLYEFLMQGSKNLIKWLLVKFRFWCR